MDKVANADVHCFLKLGSWRGRAGRARSRLHGSRGCGEAVGGGAQLHFTGVLCGLHNHLRQAIEQAARPRWDGRVADQLDAHIGIQTALGRAVVNAYGNDIIARMEVLPSIKSWLRLPIMRFANKPAVDEIPPFVIAAAEAEQRAVAQCARKQLALGDRQNPEKSDCHPGIRQ